MDPAVSSSAPRLGSVSQDVFLIGGDAAMEFKVSHRNTGPLYVYIYIYIHMNVCVYIYIYTDM